MNPRLRRALNVRLDNLVSPTIEVQHRLWPAFQVCGYTGLALAILVTMALTLQTGRSPLAMVGIVLVGVLTFFGLAIFTKVLYGGESLTYYHHEFAVLALTTIFLWLARQPVLPYLDMTILGVGAFLACGRVGCLMVGCCHGVPESWGVCYRDEHSAAGFPSYLVGVRLLPIQAIESLWVFGAVVVGAALVLAGRPPGEALVWYLVCYGAGRFFFEFLRGDAARPYYCGFSQPQWTSLVRNVLFVAAGIIGLLPLLWWHLGAAVLLVAVTVGVALKRRYSRTAAHELLRPHHVKELAEALEWISVASADGTYRSDAVLEPAEIPVACTSLGVQVSASKIENEAGGGDHYTLSLHNGAMSEEAARSVARLIVFLRHPSASTEMINGGRDIYHVLVRTDADAVAAQPVQ